MFENVGIIRSEKSLKEALRKIKLLKKEYKYSGASEGLMYNFELLNVVELEGMLNLAETIILSALKRRESRGVHFREDFPEEKDSFIKHFVFENIGGKHKIRKENVRTVYI